MQYDLRSNAFYIAALSPPIPPLAWIGLMDVTGNNLDWRWIVDNTNLTFSNWLPSQPDQSSQQCVIVVLPNNDGDAPGLWRDATCKYKGHAICETNRVSENN